MALLKSKPTSPGRRGEIRVSRDVHKGKPEATLLADNKKSGGRNNSGHITVRHIGGGTKQKYRLIDFKRQKDDIEGRVERIEYDPNRTAFIALIVYKDGEKRYIVAPAKLKKDDIILSGENSSISVGNTLPIKKIPLGTVIHCVELKPGKGAQLLRSAGSSGQVLGHEGTNYVLIKLRSGEVRKILATCSATVGEVSNSEHALKSLGKAGAKRHRGVRPTVRGVAMNPVDHPHGGGEGRTSGGRHPVTPWGVPTKGYKTRSNKLTDKFIVRRAKKRK